MLALGVAACGSSNDTSSSTSSSSASRSSSGGSATLNGAGSTFAAPIYQQGASDLKDQGLTVNYQAVGSGAGVAQFTAGTVDFAGTDPALKDEEIAALKKGEPIEAPIAFGAITVSYNLPDIKSGLKLDGKTIADIYLGKVKKWNDPEIAGQNSGLKLPATDITVVHRSDSSGTTKGFTDFLSRYSPEWKSGPGVDKDVKWPTGTGAKGNDGVAAAVKQTEGAIGYVEQAYALQNNFTFADVKNKSGKYVAPTLESTSAAGDGIDIPARPADQRDQLPQPEGLPDHLADVRHHLQGPLQGRPGQEQGRRPQEAPQLPRRRRAGDVEKLSYATLPSALQSKAQSAIDGMQCNGSPLGS